LVLVVSALGRLLRLSVKRVQAGSQSMGQPMTKAQPLQRVFAPLQATREAGARSI
jgi:hypothetical protein